jgi:uncharacterized membrane protein
MRKQTMRDWKLTLIVASLGLIATQGAVWAQAEYSVLNLRLEAGTSDIKPYVPYAINDWGQVTGHGYHQMTDDRAHPYMYNPGGVHEFICLGDMDVVCDHLHGGNGYAINNSGWITGRNEQRTVASYYRAFYWHDDNNNGLSNPGEMRNLGAEDPYYISNGWGMNNLGNVVGSSYYSDAGGSHTEGWVWKDANGNSDYETAEKTYLGDYIPVDINDLGQIVMSGPGNNGYRWTDFNGDGVVDLGEAAEIPNVEGGTEEGIDAINRWGQVAGSIRNVWDKKQGFLWTDANRDNVVDEYEVQTFGHMFYMSHMRGMNDVGQIVGGTYAFYQPTDGRRKAFVWDPIKGLRDLNTLIDYEVEGMGEFHMSQAEGINNRGQIIAVGEFSNFEAPTFRDDFGVILNGPAVLVCQTFLQGQRITEDLGWTIGNEDADTLVELFGDEEETVLRLMDEGTEGSDAVSISRRLNLGEEYTIQFEYEFATSGLLELIVGGQVVDSIGYTGPAQEDYTQYVQTFTNAAAGMFDVAFRLSDAVGLEILLDNIHIETYLPALVPGDGNGDGMVTDADYTVWADNYGAENADVYMGDYNGDSRVTDADYTIWADNYGAGVMAVPEPVTLALFAVGGLLLGRRKR